jgi:DNA-binding Lrp family transcriptional regulator
MIAKNDFCVTYEQLAAHCKISISTAKRLVRELLKRGHLKVESGKSGRVANQYKPVIFNGVRIDPVEDDATGSELTRLKDQPEGNRVKTDPVNRVKSDLPTVSDLTHLSPKSLSQESPKSPRVKDIDVLRDRAGALHQKAQPDLQVVPENKQILSEEELHHHEGSSGTNPQDAPLHSSTNGALAAELAEIEAERDRLKATAARHGLDWFEDFYEDKIRAAIERHDRVKQVQKLPDRKPKPEIDYGEVDPDWAKRNPEGWDNETP